jgi:putative sterol carrier protein
MARATSAGEVLAAMPSRFLAEQAAGMQATFQFDLSGEGGGQWRADIANGKLEVSPGTAENPNVTLSMAANDFLSMVNGELNAMQAFMQGKIKVRGDMALVMRMQKLFAWS